ncbi:hypothetical protein LTR84_000078 [Exophiala bonariae]|uniref:GFO/IDH/MocA-like oxidoreductase domain-containing protein n=1 Tax=Exophiala bonariae TaxID=1690606 RepID=A0AAV9NTK0_9EURO|nr:hypothetical protein LTR84_000078 [Exophiala bonariae]
MPDGLILPIANQKDYIRAALEAGKHVLSEKPVAKNLEEAHELITCDTETDWRKNPVHQGGFLLDGGVHYVAGLRRLLESQPSSKVCRLSSFTTLLQSHLPPVDTINAILKLESGVSGTYQQSVGTSLTGSEWTVGYEHGVVSVAGSKVVVTVAGNTEVNIIEDERTGVPPVVRIWAEAIAAGITVKDLEPEEALADLEVLELMLRSGESDGLSMSCQYQHIVSNPN